MWHSGTWFSGGPGSAWLTVGLNDLNSPFQPKQFCDSLQNTFQLKKHYNEQICSMQAKGNSEAQYVPSTSPDTKETVEPIQDTT